MESLEVCIFDQCFVHQESASLMGDNTHLVPLHFRWKHGSYGEHVTFFSDWDLAKVKDSPSQVNVAWLIEPPSSENIHYREAEELKDLFDVILTFDRRLTDRGLPYLYYPFGGICVDVEAVGLKPKTELVSLIASEKNESAGHKLRHEVARHFRDRVHLYGRAYYPVAAKYEALAQFAYSIVIESHQMDDYFTEKLVDAIAVGCVPIYWGTRNIGKYFNEKGIIQFQEAKELGSILDRCNMDDYMKRKPYLLENLDISHKYACCEDWLFHEYPFLFRSKA